MPESINSLIEQASQLSVEPENKDSVVNATGLYVINWMATANGIIPPWWSTTRDKKLREFWKGIDYLSGALYTMVSKMTAIPNRVIPRNISVKKYAEQAEFLTEVIHRTPGKGKGWVSEYGKFVEDLLSQDNGGFLEVIGAGDPSGPIIGQPVSFAHLDSFRCQRTGNPIYPVVYNSTNNKRYKMHYTRVMFSSQMESPIAEMFGVGFCAVSRCLMIAQELSDILTFKQEKMGSRPHRKLIITKGGLDPGDLASALARADQAMDQEGLSRYSKIVISGSSSMPDADVREVDLSNLPDGFNEESSVIYGMATIALAFGVDARELFPAMSAGATRADAMLQHLKERGKGPGQILLTTEQMFNYKFIPSHLTMEFDYQDDAEDRQVADIRQLRANARVQDKNTGAITTRVMRERMMEDGDITRSQFERMEIEEGRLPNGDNVLSLFYQKGGETSRLLDVGVSDPLNLEKNDPEKMLKNIAKCRSEVLSALSNAVSENARWNATVAESALNHLELMYKELEINAKLEETAAKPVGSDGKPAPTEKKPAGKTDPNRIETRLRTQDTRSPTKADMQGGSDKKDFAAKPG